jgi:XRE family transcriptional regulator, aerobic/anaerobic benzoate catabolism transcriptional regulator
MSDEKNPFLLALGERVLAARTHLGITRRALAQSAHMSERHLASLEYGVGNVSVLVLQQVALALQCRMIDLLGEGDAAQGNSRRIALVGLRGAGKSTLGQLLAKDLGFAFVELGRAIPALAGCEVSEIHALYGPQAYRRYERRALEDVIQMHADVVVATPGGLVSDATSLALLLANFKVVWLRASPQDHMQRVAEQGDMRPMAASKEAMTDLKAILAARSPFYARAPLQINTSAQAIKPTLALLKQSVRQVLSMPASNVQNKSTPSKKAA